MAWPLLPSLSSYCSTHSLLIKLWPHWPFFCPGTPQAYSCHWTFTVAVPSVWNALLCFPHGQLLLVISVISLVLSLQRGLLWSKEALHSLPFTVPCFIFITTLTTIWHFPKSVFYGLPSAPTRDFAYLVQHCIVITSNSIWLLVYA